MSSTISGGMGSSTTGNEARKVKDQAESSASNVGSTMGSEARKLKDQMESSAERVGDDAKDELAKLRAQVERLMSEKVTPALASAADSMQGYAEQARDVVEDQAEMLSDTVRDRPLVAVVVAAVSGYLLGRLMGGNTYVYPRG